MLRHWVLAKKFQTFLECAVLVLPCIEFMYRVSGALVSRALQWFPACVHSLKQVKHVLIPYYIYMGLRKQNVRQWRVVCD